MWLLSSQLYHDHTLLFWCTLPCFVNLALPSDEVAINIHTAELVHKNGHTTTFGIVEGRFRYVQHTGIIAPCWFCRMWFNKVVLPVPRKPVMMHTLQDLARAISSSIPVPSQLKKGCVLRNRHPPTLTRKHMRTMYWLTWLFSYTHIILWYSMAKIGWVAGSPGRCIGSIVTAWAKLCLQEFSGWLKKVSNYSTQPKRTTCSLLVFHLKILEFSSQRVPQACECCTSAITSWRFRCCNGPPRFVLSFECIISTVSNGGTCPTNATMTFLSTSQSEPKRGLESWRSDRAHTNKEVKNPIQESWYHIENHRNIWPAKIELEKLHE